ncbi:MAG: hypothetical protein Kow00114_27940 [Kiloniellaceae bacterium]
MNRTASTAAFAALSAALAAAFFLLGGLPAASAQSGGAAVARLAAACGAPRACLAEAFLFNGTAVHPLILRSLAGLPSDGRATVTAIDLEAAATANQFCCADSFEVSLDAAGHVGATLDLAGAFSAAQLPREDCPEGCWFAYRFHGRTAGGVQIVQTWERSGGTQTFSSLLFLTQRRSGMFDGEGWRQRLQLVSLGKLNLGDAAEAPIAIRGDSVFVGTREIPIVH